MVDWVAGLADATVAERDSGYTLVRVPGTPDVLKEAAVAGFLTKDASGNAGIGTSSPASRIHAYLATASVLNEILHTLEISSTGGVAMIFKNAFGALGQIVCGPVDQSSGANDGILDFRTATDTVLSTKMSITNVGHVLAGVDNTQTLGSAAKRWSTVYAATGSINTSDEREKTWRGGLTDDEYAVGRALIAELGFYQWTEERDKKGADNARFHFGPRAQRIWAICADYGMAPKLKKNGKPDDDIIPVAFLCFDEWAEESEDEFETIDVEVDEEISQPTGKTVEVDGKTLNLSETVTRKMMRSERRVTGGKVVRTKGGYRYGLRIDELNSFLIAVQARRQDELEARLIDLEAGQ